MASGGIREAWWSSLYGSFLWERSRGEVCAHTAELSRRRTLLAAVLLWLFVSAGAVAQGGRISRQEALSAAFPGAVIKAEQVFLTKQQMARISEFARVDVESGLVARYVATLGGQVEGRAYVDTHIVRTKRESLLISLTGDGVVKRIDVTAFLEPPEYRAGGRWLGQYTDRQLDDDLQLRRAIRSIAGATLTGSATNAAVRRVLAIDQVLEQSEETVER